MFHLLECRRRIFGKVSVSVPLGKGRFAAKDFCVPDPEETLAKYGKPDIFNTGQGGPCTGFAFPHVPRDNVSSKASGYRSRGGMSVGEMEKAVKVVIIGHFTEYSQKRIAQEFPSEWKIDIVAPENATHSLSDADIVIPEHIRVDKAFLDQAPHLKLVQTGAGFDNVDIDECTRRNVWAANAAGVNAVAVAEHVLAFILSWYKNIPYLDSFMKNREDEKRLLYTGSELAGKTIGILGLGAIGRNVAKYCNALDMRVIAHSRHIRPRETKEKIEMVDVDALYRESDIVTAHIPLTDQTRHMLNAAVFKAMKNTALLINTSRGSIVHERDLVEALKDGTIAAACLDVFEKEPLPVDSELRNMRNVLLTPHTAGMPDGLKFHKIRYRFFLKNIRRVLAGEAPDSALNTI
jgi:D-3-phosphoglycerate dehydrogenase